MKHKVWLETQICFGLPGIRITMTPPPPSLTFHPIYFLSHIPIHKTTIHHPPLLTCHMCPGESG